MTTLSILCGNGDCYGPSHDGVLITGSTILALAGQINIDEADERTWMPFVLPLPKGKTIQSAVIRWIATDDRTEPVGISIYCEGVDNAVPPADITALFAKALTSGHSNYSLATYNIGVEYSYDLTAAVQEILNRAGWVYGNTLAVLVTDDGTTLFRRREIASSENATYAEPKLDITFQTFVPRGSILI